MVDGGGPGSMPWEKTSKWEDKSLTCPFPQEAARNTGLLTRGPAGPRAGRAIKTLGLTLSASLFYCLHVLRIGDPADGHCTGLAGNLVSVSVIIVVRWSRWVSVMTLAVRW